MFFGGIFTLIHFKQKFILCEQLETQNSHTAIDIKNRGIKFKPTNIFWKLSFQFFLNFNLYVLMSYPSIIG